MSRRPTPEGSVLKAVLDLLAVHHVWHRRMNTGAVKTEHRGKSRVFRFGSKGMADVLALAPLEGTSACYTIWVEAKAPGGKQSEAQKAFQAEVEAEGHVYLLVDDVQQLADWLKERGL